MAAHIVPAQQTTGEPAVIYVLAHARSGSTLLDMLLGAHPQAQGVGELRRVDEWLQGNHGCSCGQPIRECPFWTRVRADPRIGPDFHLGAPGRVQRAVAFVSGGRSLRRGYGQRYATLRTAVRDAASKPILVDSSKTWVGWSATRAVDDSAAVVLLLRNGLAYVNSVRKVVKRPARADQRVVPVPTVAAATRTWLVRTQLMLAEFARTPAQRRAVVRYESLAADPQGVLQALCGRLGLTYSPAMLAPRSEALHNIAGSRRRFDNAQSLAIRLDDSWRNELPAADQRTFLRLAGWLNRRLGYSDREAKD